MPHRIQGGHISVQYGQHGCFNHISCGVIANDLLPEEDPIVMRQKTRCSSTCKARVTLPSVDREPMLHFLRDMVPPPECQVCHEHPRREGAVVLVSVGCLQIAVPQVDEGAVAGLSDLRHGGGPHTVLREGPIVVRSNVGREQLPDVACAKSALY